jgi:5-methylcytosine-specific restriction endonuclease McrA
MGRPRLKRIKQTCKFCKKGLEVRPSEKGRPFCSKQCYHAWQGAQRPKVKCAWCGKTFSVSPALVKDFNFCNRACVAQWRRENWKGKGAPQYTGKRTQICPECRKEFERVNTNQRTCSPQCRGKWASKHLTGERAANWQGGPVTVKCAKCGQLLERLRSEVASRSERFFCNLECRGQWMSQNIVGKNHPNWRGGWEYDYGPNWEEQREKTCQRDGYACQVCNASKSDIGQNPDVHHIIPFREFGYIPCQNDNYLQANRLKNLVSLCPSCHKKAEWGLITF